MKLRTGTVYSMQFHKEIVYFNPKMDHVLDFAIVDEFNRAGFVVAPYSTPEEESSVKSASGPARHVSCRRSESERVSTVDRGVSRRQHIEDG